jgi:hypothetical protein
MTDEVEKCTYCEKPGELITVRGMQGKYHLRCVDKAKKAWEAVRPPGFLARFRR